MSLPADFPRPEKHVFVEQDGSPDCAVCGTTIPFLHVDPEPEAEPEPVGYEQGDLVLNQFGEPFRVEFRHYEGLVFVPYGPVGQPQKKEPMGARLLVRGGEVVT